MKLSVQSHTRDMTDAFVRFYNGLLSEDHTCSLCNVVPDIINDRHAVLLFGYNMHDDRTVELTMQKSINDVELLYECIMTMDYVVECIRQNQSTEADGNVADRTEAMGEMVAKVLSRSIQ